jgi:hypothetical protein
VARQQQATAMQTLEIAVLLPASASIVNVRHAQPDVDI